MENKAPVYPPLSHWIKAIRPFSLTATFVPVLFGIFFTLTFYPGQVNWYLLILILLGTPLFQLSGNLLSEYSDYKNKVDTEETIGPSSVIIEGLIRPKTLLTGGIVASVVLLIIGLVLTYFRGPGMLVIGLIGLVAVYFYSIMKYHALGDFYIFLFFGPFMVFGTFYALTGSYELIQQIITASVPIGFLVVSILHANNTRDIKHDREAGIKTVAGVLGLKYSKIYYDSLLLGSYVAIVLFIVLKFLPVWTLIVFVTLPLSLKNIKVMSKAKIEQPENIGSLDVNTAKLHLSFGLLLCIGLLISYFVR